MKHAVKKSIAALVAGMSLVVPVCATGAEQPASGLQALSEEQDFAAGLVHRANVFFNDSGSAQPETPAWKNLEFDSCPARLAVLAAFETSAEEQSNV